jgi:hypothetical protein
MFQLTAREFRKLRSQIVTANMRRSAPYAFTEEGVAMLSSVLRSARAVRVNIEIMRAFVGLRELMNDHRDLAQKIDALEKRYDATFQVVFDAIRELVEKPQEPPKMPPKPRIGYLTAGTPPSV